MDLTLWTAAKNCLKGEWIKVCEVTPFLLEIFSGDSTSAGQTVKALNSQITCITWSQQADFGLTPSPAIDASLLIGGNRAGSLVLLRYRPNENVQHALTLPVVDKWITHVSCSPWTPVKPGTCEALITRSKRRIDGNRTGEAFVAYSAADGAVQISKLTQTYTYETSDAIASLALNASDAEKVADADKVSVSALSWMEIPNKGHFLVYCKAGMLYLWRHSTPDLGWSGLHSFRLKTQKLSVGSSSLHPASGIQYVARHDILILTLFDGSFHVVYNLLGEPTMTPPAGDNLATTEALSRAARSVFVQSEQEVDFGDMNRITGLTSYDGYSTFIWLQEASRPADFSYKHDAKHSSTFLVSTVWNGSDDDALVDDLKSVLNGAKTGTLVTGLLIGYELIVPTAAGLAPLYVLRPFFFQLRERAKLNALYRRILEILQPQNDDHSVLINLPVWKDMTPDFRQTFRRSLVQHLFGWDVLLSLRMRLSMADFVWKYIGSEEKQGECGHVAQDLLNKISHRVLRTIIRHLTAAADLLTFKDIPFVLRMVVQSLLPGSPKDLSAEGSDLQKISQATINSRSPTEPVTNSFNERCPACGVEVPLQDITTAVCSNGHRWEYVDTNLIGSGKVSRAAIVGLQGGVWAASAGYELVQKDWDALIKAVNDPTNALSNGVVLRGNKYLIVRNTDRSLYGKKVRSRSIVAPMQRFTRRVQKADGIVIVKTTQAILVAEYDQPLQAGETTPVVETLADYLISHIDSENSIRTSTQYLLANDNAMPRSLDLVVTVQYRGSKGLEFSADNFAKGLNLLRKDLLALKFPHPKTDNVIIRALPDNRGECSFMWSSVPTRKVSMNELVMMDPHKNAWRFKWDAHKEAQILLDEICRKPKPEAVDAILKPSSPARDSVASSVPSSPHKGRIFPMSIPSLPPKPVKVERKSPVVPPGLSLLSRPFNPYASTSSLPPRPYPCPHPDPHPHPSSATSQKRKRSADSSAEPPARRPQSPIWSGDSLLPISSDPSSKIERLQSELLATRRYIKATMLRESEITAELQSLGTTVSARETPEESALREKLHVAEQNLKAETNRRVEAETALEDLRRECREPFLVPEIFDVVETISRLTTRAIGVI
ncbi:hypothetical protein H0H92_012724 [Tricholoma furcatifolium]|nr:hypothetical protein H0H92_012724 [Tricholoma furcatifolium]